MKKYIYGGEDEGRIGYFDPRVLVAYCVWCAFGVEVVNPESAQEEIECHYELRHVRKILIDGSVGR